MSDPPIIRVLFLTPRVHIYQIPPLTSSTSGFTASSWTAPPRPTATQIFTARLRIVETSVSTPSPSLKVDILLEDPATGDLFAGAPYTVPAVVQQANDSSRFFAVRVVGDGGMKATLGMGFEERSEAFDFGVCLGEVKRVLGWEKKDVGAKWKNAEEVVKKDFSLKEGEKVHINVPGGNGRRRAARKDEMEGEGDGSALFSIAPPPAPSAGGGHSTLPSIAPPSAVDIHGKSAQELGFDDGEFGEFQ